MLKLWNFGKICKNMLDQVGLILLKIFWIAKEVSICSKVKSLQSEKYAKAYYFAFPFPIDQARNSKQARSVKIQVGDQKMFYMFCYLATLISVVVVVLRICACAKLSSSTFEAAFWNEIMSNLFSSSIFWYILFG